MKDNEFEDAYQIYYGYNNNKKLSNDFKKYNFKNFKRIDIAA